ncbi:hypothetical protein HYALB_00009826 [Hymenoscyphus albidus]|uniref:DUF833-domain-containing protein n=1 Tax=Hymenoscyphus albidus TaxID=595503 RepID=A0A9N9LXG7_9HELO|nr:hypothetical protein HYALB_00009826 [Hymenoscyphus albidus]
MCIVLLTTAHPDYSLIILDNRDEFIVRPTSRPHWWSSHNQEVLSARDLQRAEQGTWMGITKTGNFAVLTNYRETDAEQPIQGAKSRGGMVTAWLESKDSESTEHFVHRTLDEEGVAGIGGFSLLFGKLRKEKTGENVEPLGIISNRCDTSSDVPWIGQKRGEVYGLSNTLYDDPIPWPKVEMGKELLSQVVEKAVSSNLNEKQLVDLLYQTLDADTLPKNDGQEFEEYIYQLRKSIFIPAIGSAASEAVPKADAIASANSEVASESIEQSKTTEKLTAEFRSTEAPTPTPTSAPMTGIYGTQRQTIILVDWEGNVSFRERALWDEEGNPIERGKGDMKFEFTIEGWHGN